MIAFLTQTHRRYKRDRSMWDAERQQMQVNAAFFPLFFVADIILAFGVVEPHRCWSDLTPVAFPTTHTHAQFQARIAVLEGEKVGVEQLSTFFFFFVWPRTDPFFILFYRLPPPPSLDRVDRQKTIWYANALVLPRVQLVDGLGS